MSIRLRELIRNVRACKTQADERGCIHKECAAIRTAFKEENNELRHRNVAKLLFIHMLGYPTHWGQMECLKLIAGGKFLEKRIGYLGLMILLDERQEVLMLVENSLKNDLQSSNQYIAGLACCAIGNISSPEICRDLSPEVEKLMVGSNPFVSKKAALCSIRILRKCPELVDTFMERVGTMLGSRNHAVLLTSLKLMREMSVVEPAMVEQLRRHTSTLIAALKNLVLSGYAPEHDVHGIVDPFLQAPAHRAHAAAARPPALRHVVVSVVPRSRRPRSACRAGGDTSDAAHPGPGARRDLGSDERHPRPGPPRVADPAPPHAACL